MKNNYELGYTPANLKSIQAKYKIRNNKMAGMMGCTIETICYWRTDTTKKHHVTMRHSKWLEFLAKIDWESIK